MKKICKTLVLLNTTSFCFPYVNGPRLGPNKWVLIDVSLIKSPDKVSMITYFGFGYNNVNVEPSYYSNPLDRFCTNRPQYKLFSSSSYILD